MGAYCRLVGPGEGMRSLSRLIESQLSGGVLDADTTTTCLRIFWNDHGGGLSPQRVFGSRNQAEQQHDVTYATPVIVVPPTATQAPRRHENRGKITAAEIRPSRSVQTQEVVSHHMGPPALPRCTVRALQGNRSIAAGHPAASYFGGGEICSIKAFVAKHFATRPLNIGFTIRFQTYFDPCAKRRGKGTTRRHFVAYAVDYTVWSVESATMIIGHCHNNREWGGWGRPGGYRPARRAADGRRTGAVHDDELKWMLAPALRALFEPDAQVNPIAHLHYLYILRTNLTPARAHTRYDPSTQPYIPCDPTHARDREHTLAATRLHDPTYPATHARDPEHPVTTQLMSHISHRHKMFVAGYLRRVQYRSQAAPCASHFL